jgi:anti-sigma regulatory factor (Ser/Thr protein kinase)
LHLTRPAHAVELRSIRRAVEEWARRSGLSSDVLVDLQLALGEAVANGVEHAYDAGDAGTVDIELELRCSDRAGDDPAGGGISGDDPGGDDPGGDVVVRVSDRGRWRPVPERSGNRGRGLLMIEQLARRVRVRTDDSGTEVCFAIPLPA